MSEKKKARGTSFRYVVFLPDSSTLQGGPDSKAVIRSKKELRSLVEKLLEENKSVYVMRVTEIKAIERDQLKLSLPTHAL